MILAPLLLALPIGRMLGRLIPTATRLTPSFRVEPNNVNKPIVLA